MNLFALLATWLLSGSTVFVILTSESEQSLMDTYSVLIHDL
jgi:hypothetical protein